MGIGNEVKTNEMGDYFALVGDHLLQYGDNGNTHCKLTLQLISNGNHKDVSRMLCQYLETAMDVAVNMCLPYNASDDENSVQVCFLQSPHCIPNWGNCF